MSLAVRKAFPYVILVLVTIALGYATNFGTLPPADFSFNNGTEVKTVDPPKATGVPEGRVIDSLFQGLLQRLPAPDAPPPSNRSNTPMTMQWAMADDMKISDDGKVYTFHIRHNAKWSNGDKVTAEDFVWSWQRMLHPETASEYSYLLWHLIGAKNYTEAKVEPNDRVEIELADRRDSAQLFPRGTILRGTLMQKHVPPEETDKKKLMEATVYEVEIEGQRRAFCLKPAAVGKWFEQELKLETCLYVLPDFESTVGLKAKSIDVLEVRLNHPTSCFADLVGFYPLYPTHRGCVEKFGSPAFTQPENIITNGAYRLAFRRIRDRIRLEKNPHYWNAEQVKLNTIDVYAVSSDVAALNMYLTGKLDWITNVPPTIIPDMRERDDFYSATQLSTYFYRVNCTRKPLDDKRVRRALCMTIEKQKICDKITKGGETITTCFVPPGLTGYVSPPGVPFDVEGARKLLVEAGFPNGQGFPKVEIIINTSETHQAIAEVIQEDWKKHLGIDVELRALEWGTYLDHQIKLQYDVARAGWTADYPDPNTYIDMFVTNGANNQTGWSNTQYDALVKAAGEENDAAKRLSLLAEAEAILLDEQPILPIYSYVTKNMVRRGVQGFSLNLQDLHPLHIMSVDRNAATTSSFSTPRSQQ
jgi:oligopeptide transport system substrate-binding protein